MVRSIDFENIAKIPIQTGDQNGGILQEKNPPNAIPRKDFLPSRSDDRNLTATDAVHAPAWPASIFEPRQLEVVASSPVPREPVDPNKNESKYVHMSEIESYVKSYLTQLKKGGPRPELVDDAVIKQLTEQIVNVGLRDSEVSRISRGEGDPQSTRVLNPVPPLQLSSQNPSSRRMLTPVTETRNQNENYFQIPIISPGPCPTSQPGWTQPPRTQFLNPGSIQSAYPIAPPMNPRRLPHQQCNIIEKWPKFSGDTNPIPVTDFLRQINILCRSYAITKE